MTAETPAAEVLDTPAPTPTATSEAKGGGMIRSSMIYSFFTLLSRMMGFARDLVVSYFMGASATFAADAFNAAFAFPNLFRRIFAEGAFAAAFVPAYSRSLEKDGEEIADVLAADAMATLAAATLALTVAAELTMPWLMRWLIAPGFAANPQKLELAILLTRITMPYLPCMAIYAHLSGVLNARNRFILSAAAPILLNVWTLVTVLPTHSPQQAAMWCAIGVLIAGVSQAALLWWGVRKSGARVDVRLPRLTPEIRKLIALAIPGAIAASATQINIFVSGILVSQVNGARSWLAVCDRLYQLPQGLVGVAVGVALLPRLSRAVQADDGPQARGAIDQAITFCMALSLPAAVGLVTIPYFLIDALYTRGAFTHVDALKTAQALQQYGWGVPAFVAVQITNRIFFAQQDTRTPMIYGLVSVGVNVVLGVALFFLVGVPGIAAATSAAWWLNVLMMNVHLARKKVYTPSPAAWSKMARILAASLAAGVLMAAAGHWRADIEAAIAALHVGHAKEFAILAVVIAAGLAYPFLLLASGGITRADIRAATKRSAAI